MTLELKPKFHGRTAARLAAIQGLYQLAQEPIHPRELIGQFVARRFKTEDDIIYDKVDIVLFEKIVEGVAQNLQQFDDKISLILADNWRLDRIEDLMVAILRAAAYELNGGTNVPKAVVINEYVNITKSFYSGSEPGFINAALDRLSVILTA